MRSRSLFVVDIQGHQRGGFCIVPRSVMKSLHASSFSFDKSRRKTLQAIQSHLFAQSDYLKIITSKKAKAFPFGEIQNGLHTRFQA